MMIIYAGDIGEEEENTKIFEPLEDPDWEPVPEPAVIPPVREPVPA